MLFYAILDLLGERFARVLRSVNKAYKWRLWFGRRFEVRIKLVGKREARFMRL